MAKQDLSSVLQMTVEDVAACQKKFCFTAEKAVIKNETKSVIKEISGMVVVPGFRKGKAPAGMIAKRYQSDILEELKRRIYSSAFQKVSSDKELDLVTYGMPADEGQELKLDEEYKFALKFDLAPSFDLGEYKGLKVKVVDAEVDQEVLKQRLDYYRDMYASYEDVAEPAAQGDMLKVTYSSDFELPENASPALTRQVKAENNWLWLNDPEMIPGAIKTLTGAEAGKEYKFTAKYPKDWRDAELQGKSVKYEVKVDAVQRRKSVSDDELAKKMQVESFEELQKTLSDSLLQQSEAKRKNEIAEEVYQQISKKIGEFELPPTILEGEVEKELRRIAQESIKNDEDAETFKKDIKKHREQASKDAADKLRRMFILRAIAKKQDIQVEQHEVEGQIKNLSRYYGYKESEFRSMLEKSGGMEDVHLDVLAAKVSEFLADNADVTAKKAKAKAKAKPEKAEEA